MRAELGRSGDMELRLRTWFFSAIRHPVFTSWQAGYGSVNSEKKERV
jgi:hypothetical protein